MSVLSVQSVSYSYKTKYQTVQAVKDVSCDLSAGTLYALVGKSGSGEDNIAFITGRTGYAAERRHNGQRPRVCGK